MAKVFKCMLSWKPSDADEIVSYRLYWSKGKSVSYESNFIEVGNVTEVCLTDVFKLDPHYDVRLMLGVTAVDMNGNESDMAILPEPYQMKTPPAPAELSLTTLDDFSVMGTTGDDASDQMETRFEQDSQQDELAELARIAKPLLES